MSPTDNSVGGQPILSGPRIYLFWVHLQSVARQMGAASLI